MYALKVEKLSCGGCANRVTRTVQALDPEAKVEVVLEDRLVRVESVKTLDAIAAAITAAGFPASDMTAA